MKSWHAPQLTMILKAVDTGPRSPPRDDTAVLHLILRRTLDRCRGKHRAHPLRRVVDMTCSLRGQRIVREGAIVDIEISVVEQSAVGGASRAVYQGADVDLGAFGPLFLEAPLQVAAG